MLALEANLLFEMGAVDDGNSDSVGSTLFCAGTAGGATCAGGAVDDGNAAGTGVSFLTAFTAAGTATTSAGDWVWVSVGMRKKESSRALEKAPEKAIQAISTQRSRTPSTMTE
jgi:hypothetical protein